LFTGLSALSRSTIDFYLYRFLTGLGVGGVFAAAVTLLAETMPDRSRTIAIGLFQASSALGNCAAAGISIGFGWAVYNDWFAGHQVVRVFRMSPWRSCFWLASFRGCWSYSFQLFG